MENKLLIAVTTYRKPKALRAFLESAFANGYKDIHVADDAQGEDSEFQGTKIGSALEVVKDFPGVVCSYGSSRGGISLNKNRNISYFLEHTEFTHMLMMDDDQVFTRPGLFEELLTACEKNRLNHITGVWSSDQPELEQLTGGGWSSVFPVQAEGYHVTWHEGSHGCAGFFTRKCIEEIGYYPILPHPYGYEHSLYTARAMLAVDKRTPKWHPQHTHAYKYYCGQSIPNNYEIENVHANSEEYLQLLTKIWQGEKLYIKESGLKPKEEKIYVN